MRKRTIWLILSILLIIFLSLGGYIFYGISGMKPMETGKINEHLYVAKTGYANFFIYQQGNNYICFDAGNKEEDSKNALDDLGIDPKIISHVFLTHSDPDHAGGVPVFSNALVYLSEKELGVMDGSTPRKIFYIKASSELTAEDFRTLPDRATIQIGNIRVESIHTPGHSPGSCSYLVNDSILFVGDALQFNRHGEFKPLFKPINNDYKLAIQSIEKIKKLNATLVVTAHDGYWRNKP